MVIKFENNSNVKENPLHKKMRKKKGEKNRLGERRPRVVTGKRLWGPRAASPDPPSHQRAQAYGLK